MESILSPRIAFSNDLKQRYSSALSKVEKEEIREFARSQSTVRKDHKDGKPNSSRKSTVKGVVKSANAFFHGKIALSSPEPIIGSRIRAGINVLREYLTK